MKDIITQMLLDMNLTPNLLGFGYLREALLLVYNDETYLRAITKRLYPAVGTRFNTTPSRAERAMRHAIEKMGLEYTVSEFLGVTCEKLRMNASK